MVLPPFSWRRGSAPVAESQSLVDHIVERVRLVRQSLQNLLFKLGRNRPSVEPVPVHGDDALVALMLGLDHFEGGHVAVVLLHVYSSFSLMVVGWGGLAPSPWGSAVQVEGAGQQVVKLDPAHALVTVEQGLHLHDDLVRVTIVLQGLGEPVRSALALELAQVREEGAPGSHDVEASERIIPVNQGIALRVLGHDLIARGVPHGAQPVSAAGLVLSDGLVRASEHIHAARRTSGQVAPAEPASSASSGLVEASPGLGGLSASSEVRLVVTHEVADFQGQVEVRGQDSRQGSDAQGGRLSPQLLQGMGGSKLDQSLQGLSVDGLHGLTPPV